MEGGLSRHKLQADAVVREYKQAHDLGAVGKKAGIREANPDLVTRFDQIDKAAVAVA